MGTTRFENGSAAFESSQYDGFLVSELRSSYTVQEFLSLSGNEGVEVRYAGSNTFNSVNENYRVGAGDLVRFVQGGGDKGLVFM